MKTSDFNRFFALDSKKGMVRTPEKLAQEMISNIPEYIFESSTTTFLDPACGRGTFLEVITKKLKSYGHSWENITSRIFGIDIDPFSGIKQAQYFFGPKNIIVQDFEMNLPSNWPEDFNIILGNPPYSGLDIKFIEKSVRIAKDHILFVHPSTFYMNKKDEVIGGKKDPLKSLINEKIKYLSLFNGNKVFGIAASYPVSVVHLDMNKKEGDFIFDDKLKNERYTLSSISEVSVFGFDREFNLFRNHISDVLKKSGNLNEISSQKVGNLGEGNFFIETNSMIGHSIVNEDARCFYKYDFFVLVKSIALEVRTGSPKAGWINWKFKTLSEAENFISYVSSDFARACVATVKFNQNLHRGELKSIPLVDFSEKWDNEKIYRHFNISEDMVDSIKRNILPYYGAGRKETKN
jgi:hypothetical protein